MKVNLYAVQDVKAHRFNPPFSGQSHVEAMRAFAQPCQNPESLWNKYPEDFSLFHIGTFDDESAQVESILPAFLSSALDHAKPKGLNDAGERYVKIPQEKE